MGHLLRISIAVAKSGFQHGGAAGAAGQHGRRFRLECKKYGDDTSVSDRELLGEIDHALARDEAPEAWILISTDLRVKALAFIVRNLGQQPSRYFRHRQLVRPIRLRAACLQKV